MNISKEESEQQEVNKRVVRWGKNPFCGKNRSQRYNLHCAFNAMSSIWQKLGMNN